LSKNFELLQEALREAERDPAPVSETTPILFPGLGVESDARRESLGLDRMAQEECLKLVQRVFLSQPLNIRRVIVFAGIDHGNGCSRLCAETARSLAANTSGTICLVDGNFRTPSLPKFFGMPDDRGLADSLLGEGAIRSFAKQLTPSNLCLLSAGDLARESTSLLNSERLKLRVQELSTEFNYVLIDAPALNLYSDAIALGRIADGLVVVLEADSTRRESALKGLDTLRGAHIEVLGAVLNRRTFPIPDFVYRRL
jgi:polysaccharide biosynthesis transport protein